MPPGRGLGIRAGQVWAFRGGQRHPLCRALVIDPGSHYDATIKIRVQEGPFEGLHSVRRAKLPCKWERVDEYLALRPQIPGKFEDAPNAPEHEAESPTAFDILNLQEEMIRRVVREELELLAGRPPKLAYSYDEAAAAVGYSRGVLRSAVNMGDLVPSYANSKPVFPKVELQRWLDSLPNDPRW